MSSNIWDATEQKLVQVSGNVNINDSVISEDSTFSSKKITDSLVDIENALEDKADVDKVVPLAYTTTVTDANDLEEGFVIARNIANAPTTGFVAYKTLSYDHNVHFRVQEATLNNTTRKFIRYCYEGKWSAWQEFATVDSIVAETKSFTLNAKYGTPTQWTCNVAKSGYKVIGVTFEHGYSAQIVMAVETWGNDVLKGYAQLALSASEINITAYAHIIYQKI